MAWGHHAIALTGTALRSPPSLVWHAGRPTDCRCLAAGVGHRRTCCVGTCWFGVGRDHRPSRGIRGAFERSIAPLGVRAWVLVGGFMHVLGRDQLGLRLPAFADALLVTLVAGRIVTLFVGGEAPSPCVSILRRRGGLSFRSWFLRRPSWVLLRFMSGSRGCDGNATLPIARGWRPCHDRLAGGALSLGPQASWPCWSASDVASCGGNRPCRC